MSFDRATTPLFRPILLGLCLLVPPGAAPGEERSAGPRIKCWTNNEGGRECGVTVPPEFAQQGHQQLDKSGNIREEVEAAPTKEELDARDAAAKDRQRQEMLEKEKLRQDQALLQTFSRVEDIEKSREEKLSALRSNIALLEKRLETLKEKLQQDLGRAQQLQERGKDVSQNLLDAISSERKQIRNNEEAIEEHNRDMEKIKRKAEQDIIRFKELTQKK